MAQGRPLEDAARVAFKAMVRWVRERTGMAEPDAYQFVSQVARAPIVQLVDPEYTVLVKIEKGRALARPTTSVLNCAEIAARGTDELRPVRKSRSKP